MVVDNTILNALVFLLLLYTLYWVLKFFWNSRETMKKKVIEENESQEIKLLVMKKAVEKLEAKLEFMKQTSDL